jgi:hypothetical protein
LTREEAKDWGRSKPGADVPGRFRAGALRRFVFRCITLANSYETRPLTRRSEVIRTREQARSRSRSRSRAWEPQGAGAGSKRREQEQAPGAGAGAGSRAWESQEQEQGAGQKLASLASLGQAP